MTLARLTAATLALLLVASQARAAAPTVRSLFVGIDTYAHSHNREPAASADFLDLEGAVADVGLMKDTLKRVYGLNVDPTPVAPAADGSCAPIPPAPVSITLTDALATRACILRSLEALIAASAEGDIVLFYYAGHGSTRYDATPTTRPFSDTLVPSDARRPPDANPHNDIIDTELRRRIDEADRVGVTVVTIFDSCSSGSATRDIAGQAAGAGGRTRDAGPTTITASPGDETGWTAPRADSAVKRYRVHMAAAGDGQDQEAHETVGLTPTHGLFTAALAQTLAERKGATYLDIAQETRWKLEEAGHVPELRLGRGLGDTVQNSQEAGELTAPFLGAAPPLGREYSADAAGKGATSLTLHAGTLSGVTPGSTFAVYLNATEAHDPTVKPLATGSVSGADQGCATLTLPPSQPLPAIAGKSPRNLDTACSGAKGGASLFVKELTHDYGAQRLGVWIDGGAPDQRQRVSDALTPLGPDRSLVRIVGSLAEGPQFRVSLRDGKAAFQNAEGGTIYAAGPVSDATFAERLGEATQAAANYFALLGLRKHGGGGSACVFLLAKGRNPPPCPAAGGQADDPPPAVSLAAGDVDMWLKNRSSDDLFHYALFLDAGSYEISLIDPLANDIKDQALIAGAPPLKFFQGTWSHAGHGVVLVLLTRSPINVAALRQEPVRDIDAAPKNDLERLLLSAGAGQRGDTVVRTGDWGAVAVEVEVTP